MYELAGVRVERIVEEDGAVAIEATPTASCAACPGCGHASGRVHGRYVRTLRDLPACGRPVQVRLRMRPFVCRATECPKRTFVEQVAGATAPQRAAGAAGAAASL